MEKEKAVIYAIKSGEDTCHYIGKTIQQSAEGDITKCLISSAYTNPALIEVFESHKEDISIEPVKKVDVDEWYDEKLVEVVDKYKDNHPLVNAQWMLDGKRGIEWWKGKKRDAHTIQRLAESKYIRVCQYSEKGKLVKVWNGGKEAAQQVFGDYEVVKFSGKTQLYNALRAQYVKNKFKQGSYWFREYELLEKYGKVPNKLDIPKLMKQEDVKKKAERKNSPPTVVTRYTVLQYDENRNVINSFKNTAEAAYELRIPIQFVQRICRGLITNKNYLIGYGDKLTQLPIQPYPSYKADIIPDIKPPKVKMSSKTTTPVLHYKGDKLLRTYHGGVIEAMKKLGLNEYKVRKLCRTREEFYGRRLEFGKKETVLTPVK